MQMNKVNKHLEKLGINGLAYFSKRYGVSRRASSFKNVSTKQVSAMVSDLMGLYQDNINGLIFLLL